ncbi:ABC transporter substrate-binding protein [Janibacter melonis]|nr:ABC transporter substrate-binding protein [Janibacter melonis]
MAIAGISAAALVATACGGGSSSSDDAGTSGATGQTGGEFVIGGCNPENPLVAGNTSETCGGDVLNILTSKLVKYSTEDAKPENDIAESIETEDGQNFTIKLKEGYKFHDGTDVLAKNFVDAWNYTAAGANGQSGSYFMEPIEGYKDVSGKDSKKTEMTGLKVVDDLTFTVKTTEPNASFPLRLGYSAYAPQPDAFFDDPKAFGEKPIAAGPYKLDSWEKNKSIVLSKFDDYSGDFAGKADKITFQIFQDPDTEYTALQAGEIDAIKQVPSSALVDDVYKTDFPDRNSSTDSMVLQYLGMTPGTDPRLEDVNVRRALSMAIDRQEISDAIFGGTRTPATGWVPPILDGATADACGEYCTFDAEKAKELLDEAGGFEGELTISYNGDGPHKEWLEATCNQLKNNLGIDCTAKPAVDFATFLKDLEERKTKGLWRLGWQADYPSVENYLTPIYSVGADSNYGDYDNPDFQAKIKEGDSADDVEQANTLYGEAEKLLAEDMPSIPMFYVQTQVAWSEKISDVKVTPFGYIDLTQVTVNS